MYSPGWLDTIIGASHTSTRRLKPQREGAKATENRAGDRRAYQSIIKALSNVRNMRVAYQTVDHVTPWWFCVHNI